jgi:hypothetical protein
LSVIVPIDTNIRRASMRQIHGTIEHMHRGDFECAITLAGAGEGILPDADKVSLRQKLNEISQSPEIKAEGGATGPNDYINWLKHGSLKRGGPRFENATIPAEESIAVILRAIAKYEVTYNDISQQMLTFRRWAKEWLTSDVAAGSRVMLSKS